MQMGCFMVGIAARQVEQSGTMRLSVSLPRDVYQALEAKAAQNDVSLAWVVRKAVADYLDQDVPLLRAGH